MAEALQIRESQVEDVLASFPHIAQRVLDLPETPQLIARQMTIPSGRLDLLYATGGSLMLVELKVEGAKREFIRQTQGYRADLKGLQSQGKLLAAPITPVLLCTSFPRDIVSASEKAGVQPVAYQPEDVLAEFFRSLRPLAELISLRPACGTFT